MLDMASLWASSFGSKSRQVLLLFARLPKQSQLMI